MNKLQPHLMPFYLYGRGVKWGLRTTRGDRGILRDKSLREAVMGRCGGGWRGWWYSMWQTPGTHASSTFHAAHSLDAGLPPVPLPSSQHRFVCPHNLPAKEGDAGGPIPAKARLPSLPHPLHPLSLFCALTLCSVLASLYPGCLHPLPLQPTAWRHKETPPWQR